MSTPENNPSAPPNAALNGCFNASLSVFVLQKEKGRYHYPSTHVSHPLSLSPSPLQSARRSVHGGRARRAASAATPSVWAAARCPTATRPARRACITSTRAAAWPTAPRGPTSSRAGAASAPSSASKSTASSSTARSAWASAPLDTPAPRPTGEARRAKKTEPKI